MKCFVVNLKNKVLYNNIKEYQKQIKNYSGKKRLIMAPGNPYLTMFRSNNYDLCSQDISPNDFICTGEESGLVLKSIGCKYVIIGHSERKKFFDDEYVIEKKVNNALNNNLFVIYCIGENEKEPIWLLKNILRKQINNIFNYVDKSKLSNILIAYEPSWSIGSNNTRKINEIEEIICFIKDYVLKRYRENIKILYGGSVDITNIKALNKVPFIDGYLVSSSAIDANNLLLMLEM